MVSHNLIRQFQAEVKQMLRIIALGFAGIPERELVEIPEAGRNHRPESNDLNNINDIFSHKQTDIAMIALGRMLRVAITDESDQSLETGQNRLAVTQIPD